MTVESSAKICYTNASYIGASPSGKVPAVWVRSTSKSAVVLGAKTLLLGGIAIHIAAHIALGRRQVVRHQVLVQAFGSSNLSAPAKQERSLLGGLFCLCVSCKGWDEYKMSFRWKFSSPPDGTPHPQPKLFQQRKEVQTWTSFRFSCFCEP